MKVQRILPFILTSLITCTMQAQNLQISSPFPVKIALDSAVTSTSQSQFQLEIPASATQRVTIIRHDSVLLNKYITLGPDESRCYLIEENGLGGYQLFYRSESLRRDSQYQTLQWVTWAGTTISPEQAPTSNLPILADSLSPELAEPFQAALPTIMNSASSFEDLIQQLEQTDYEFSRSQLIIQWSDKNILSVAEIAQLSTYSQFDPARFLLLRTLYNRCSNPDDYEQLGDTFAYPEYENQFLEWFNQQRETTSSPELH